MAWKILTPVFKLNGFSSLEEMNMLHELILEVLRDSPPHGSVLDLGAGNGYLLKRIKSEFHCRVRGIELVPYRADGNPDIIIGDTADVGNLPLGFDTILVSINRFGECAELQPWCMENSRQTVIYSYDEPVFARIL